MLCPIQLPVQWVVVFRQVTLPGHQDNDTCFSSAEVRKL
jgi:hypothetical protein